MAEIAQTADHALRILEELGDGEPLSLTQLCERLGLNRTVAHRLLKTLGNRGFVLRQGSLYRPGPALVRIASVMEPTLRMIAGPVMEHLAEEVGETVVLHVIDGLQAVVLEQAVTTRHVVQVNHQIGSRHPLTVGASGRAILAHLPEAATRKALNGIEDAGQMATSLDTVRQDGFALSHDELQDGVHGIAVPLRAADGVAVGSLAILAPSSRSDDLERFAGDLRAAAAEVEKQHQRFSVR